MHAVKRILPLTIGGLAPVSALIALNLKDYWQFYHPQSCFDCGVKIGTPFAFWQSESFGGGNQILWLGLLSDIAFGAVLIIIGMRVGQRVSRYIAGYGHHAD